MRSLLYEPPVLSRLSFVVVGLFLENSPCHWELIHTTHFQISFGSPFSRTEGTKLTDWVLTLYVSGPQAAILVSRVANMQTYIPKPRRPYSQTLRTSSGESLLDR